MGIFGLVIGFAPAIGPFSQDGLLITPLGEFFLQLFLLLS